MKNSSVTGCTVLSLLHILKVTSGLLAYSGEEAPLSLKKHQVPTTDLIKAAPEEGYLPGKSGADYAPALQGRVVLAYEGFLEMPVVVVLVAMWLAGVTLMGLGVASLNLLWVLPGILMGGV